jgi:hypothetical protein
VTVRVTKPSHGEVDGVSLNGFEVGIAYEVTTDVGTYLIVTGSADPILPEEVRPTSDTERRIGVNVSQWQAVAADMCRSRRRSRSVK